MALVEIRFHRVTLGSAHSALNELSVLHGEGFRAVGEVRVVGGPNAGVHRDEREFPPVAASPTVPIEMTISCETEGATHLAVRFHLVGRDELGRGVDELLPPPFLQRRSESPSPQLASRSWPPPAPAYTLQWEAHTDVRAPRPAPAGGSVAQPNTTATVTPAQAPDCWEYNPADNNTLVINSVEYVAPVRDFVNWQGWDTAQNTLESTAFRSVYHQPKHPPPAGVTTCRPRSAITAIVMHETGGFNMDNRNAVADTWPNTSIAAHFAVRTDGSLTQFYDVAQLVGHAGHRNNESIGIEVVGKPWSHGRDRGETYTPPATAIDRTPRRVIRFWAGAPFAIPRLRQLEGVYRLTMYLLELLPTIPRVWQQLDGHGEPHEAGDRRKLFLINRWTAVYGFHRNSGTLTGIYAHHNIGGNSPHYDGSFEALYTWVRSEADLSLWHGIDRAEAAYRATIWLVMQRMVPHLCSDGERRMFVDVSDID